MYMEYGHNFMTDTMEGYKAQSASLVYTKYKFFIFYFLCVWVLDNDYMNMIVLFDGFWLSRFKVITIKYYLCRACFATYIFVGVIAFPFVFFYVLTSTSANYFTKCLLPW